MQHLPAVAPNEFAIARLTREAYSRHPGVRTEVQSVSTDRRGCLGVVFSADAWVLGVSLAGDDAPAAAVTWQPAVYLTG